jgi:hypothetical protein
MVAVQLSCQCTSTTGISATASMLSSSSIVAKVPSTVDDQM